VVTLYLIIIHKVGPHLVKTNVPSEVLKNRVSTYSLIVRSVFSMWNVFLAVFSIIGASRLGPKLITYLGEVGFVGSVCVDPLTTYLRDGEGFWVWIFIYSKIPELLDTFFQILRGNTPSFLHWFHHVTVLLYCWHAGVRTVGPGLWFASMNFQVHSVMYSYFAVRSCPEPPAGILHKLWSTGQKICKKSQMFITTIQIVQMIMGIVVTVVSAYHHEKDPSSCSVDPQNYKLGFVMYASYFVLFAVLFYNNYVLKKKKLVEVCGKDMDVNYTGDKSKQNKTDQSNKKQS